MKKNKDSSLQNFEAKVRLQDVAGRFIIKTITNSDELKQAFLLRYQVFQVEMIGHPNLELEDFDEFDGACDHLAIFDTKTNQMIATCRLNCSLFSTKFYSQTEFDCDSLINSSGTKLEIGRVCVHRDFRNGIIIMLLWKAVSSYMQKTEANILFGCGSVMTEESNEALLLYKYLEEEKIVRPSFDIYPTTKYISNEFEVLRKKFTHPLSQEERSHAKILLPPLCRSYFDIGCFVPCPPAFDAEFKCIDFLTVLNKDELSPRLQRKLMMVK